MGDSRPLPRWEAAWEALNPPQNPTQYALTSWFGYVKLVGILPGSLLAVWATHVISVRLSSNAHTRLESSIRSSLS
ncbi:hypothetical protein [Natronorubrum bangense]|uniref:Uncharacterized protein n=1 Tax=Natronorubrum bangense TaxID=61858 RepID=A0A4D6HIT1_9EURY|nr:hypothetical protein [Natronorubrum bangense]QCC53096.1 hypothetical protein DV706_00520 [Natronorubrum bangense]QCC56211.1 hypothetical protein DV706_16750 [Natronorubrum bangense]